MATNEFLTDYMAQQLDRADYAYGRMMDATEPDEAEHYEALYARRTNRAAVAHAESMGY